MNGKQFAATFKSLIEDAKQKGAQSINCDSLIAYLTNAENLLNVDISPGDLERMRAQFNQELELDRQLHDARLEMFKSVIAYGQGAIKSLFLLHGGAVIILLTFITHLARENPSKVPEFSDCVLPFALGVFTAALVALSAYLCQLLYGQGDIESHKKGILLHRTCISLAIVSLALFLWGLYSVYIGFQSYS
jgi:hypothetical protein